MCQSHLRNICAPLLGSVRRNVACIVSTGEGGVTAAKICIKAAHRSATAPHARWFARVFKQSQRYPISCTEYSEYILKVRGVGHQELVRPPDRLDLTLKISLALSQSHRIATQTTWSNSCQLKGTRGPLTPSPQRSTTSRPSLPLWVHSSSVTTVVSLAPSSVTATPIFTITSVTRVQTLQGLVAINVTVADTRSLIAKASVI